MFYTSMVVVVTPSYAFARTYRTVPLKRVNFTTFKLYLNKSDIVKEVRDVA